MNDGVDPQPNEVAEGNESDIEITGSNFLDARETARNDAGHQSRRTFIRDKQADADGEAHCLRASHEEIWREACLFVSWGTEAPATSTRVQRVEIKGLKELLEDWQSLAVFFHIKKMFEAEGSFNWDFLGLGKTVVTCGTLVVTHWVNEAI